MKVNSQIRCVLSRTLIIFGVVLIAAALILEGQRYPWGTLFKVSQEESSLADPAPIILKGADADSILEEYTGEEPSDPAEDTMVNNNVLPGTETEAQAAPVYVRLGVIKIPKLRISQHILEGTERQLHYGIGHVPGTDEIGAFGNCALAGHRFASFRYLNKLTAGDNIVLKTGDNTYTYSVFESFEVLPEETWVLSDIEGEERSLTLITCTPYLVSSHRLIVRARLTTVNGMTAEMFFEQNGSVS